MVLGAVMSTKGPKLQSIWEKKVDAPIVFSCRNNVEGQADPLSLARCLHLGPIAVGLNDTQNQKLDVVGYLTERS